MYRYRHQHKQAEDEQLDRWLVSYADYMTLMFALFVVLYAMALVKEEEFSTLSDTLTKVFEKPDKSETGVQGTALLSLPATQSEFELHGTSLETPKGPELLADARSLSDITQRYLGSPLVSLEQELTQSLAHLLEQGLAKVQQDENWLIIELNSGLLFASGSATATSSARMVLAEISGILQPVNNYIRVRGYTDNQSINNELFASNWELSVSRATSILHELTRLGIAPYRLAVEGFGEYYPSVSNTTEQGRAANRKVVIAVSKYGYQAELQTAEPEPVAETLPQLEQVTQDDGTIRVISLPGGGIRITTRQENPDEVKNNQQEP